MNKWIRTLVAATLLPAAGLLGAGVAARAADEAGDPAASPIQTALSGAHRGAENRARDRYRHPAETLAFFGLTPQMTVVEILPGEGWYTEILAPVLREQGKLVVASHGTDGVNDYRRNAHVALMQKLDGDPALYGAVERRVMWTGDGGVTLGPAASADMVVTFRNTHNWLREGQFEAVYRAIFDVLKPQGILGIEQHRAAPGTNPATSAEKGYVPEAYLVETLEGLGFQLVGKSEINANPKDTKDYPDGVWTLPPTYRLGDKDREKFAAIGESDRMTLKFIKP